MGDLITAIIHDTYVSGMLSPVQFLPLLSSTYPELQEHWKLPGVLTQICSHGDDVHSLISVCSKINSSFNGYEEHQYYLIKQSGLV